MVEGTKLKDISENLKILKEKMQMLTTECHNQMEERLQQVTREYNVKMRILGDSWMKCNKKKNKDIEHYRLKQQRSMKL